MGRQQRWWMPTWFHFTRVSARWVTLFFCVFAGLGCQPEQSQSGQVVDQDARYTEADGAVAPDAADAAAWDSMASLDSARPIDSMPPVDGMIAMDVTPRDSAIIPDSGDSSVDVSVQGPDDADLGPMAEDAVAPEPDSGPECGDGDHTDDEGCDDGNLMNGDGCDAMCTLEVHPIVKGSALLMDAIAGDGHDRIEFVSDAPSFVQFRVSTEGRCDGPEVMTTTLWVDGAAEPTPAEPIMIDGDMQCPWRRALLDAGEHHLEIHPGEAVLARTYQLEFRLYQVVEAGGQYSGQIAVNGDDRYEIDVGEDQRLGFETNGPDGLCDDDTWITLYHLGPDGERRVNFDNDRGVGRCSYFENQVQAGRYALVVREARHGAVGPYVLRVIGQGVCGDGVRNLREECDDGNQVADDTCSQDCRQQAVCGNGVTEVGETCDDGGRESGDGCSANCQQEPPCGDGLVEGAEECDDRNMVNGDGCDQLCSLEEIWIHVGQTRRLSRFAQHANDIFYFHADGPARLDVATMIRNPLGWGCRPSSDTRFRLASLDPNGNGILLHENDDDPQNSPCSRLSVDVGEGTFRLVVTEADDRLAIDEYTLDFRLVRDVTNLNRVGGAFPAGGADRYTFQSNVRQRFQIGVSGDAQPCPRDIVLTLFNRGAEDPLDFPQIELEGCAHLVGELAAGAYDLRVSAPADQAVDAYRLEMDWNPL